MTFPPRIEDDLDEIAGQIPRVPRAYSTLRSLLALLPSPIAARTQAAFPAGEVAQPEQAAGEMGVATGVGTVPGSALMDGSITDRIIAADAVTARTIRAGEIHVSHMADDPGGNLLPNFGFEQDGAVVDGPPTGWESGGGAAGQFDVFASGIAHGAYICQVEAVNGQPIQLQTQVLVAIEAGQRYIVGGFLRGQNTNSANALGEVRVGWYDNAGSLIGGVTTAGISAPVGSSTVLTRYAAVLVAPATAVKVRVFLRATSTSATGDKICFDDVFLYRADRDLSAAGGDVLIDSSGITIRNGRLVLEDEFGDTSMQASGFSGSWVDFLALGLYNARFAVGTVGTLANGRTAALPYWTLSDLVGSPITTYQSTKVVRIAFAALNNSKQVLSDPVQVAAGSWYECGLQYNHNRAVSCDLPTSIAIRWLDASFAQLSISAAETTNWATGTSDISLGLLRLDALAPATAAYAQLVIEVTEETGHASGNYVELVKTWFREQAFYSELDSDVVEAQGLVVHDYVVFGNNMTIGGPSFPALNVLTDDIYYRTDLGMWFTYDGTRWVCTCLHEISLGPWDWPLGSAISATTPNTHRGSTPSPTLDGADNIWIESASVAFFVSSGGTALGASHKWVGALARHPSGTAVATFNVDSGASNSNRRLDVAVNALMGTSDTFFEIDWTKTGTPGNLTAYNPLIRYRIVAS